MLFTKFGTDAKDLFQICCHFPPEINTASSAMFLISTEAPRRGLFLGCYLAIYGAFNIEKLGILSFMWAQRPDGRQKST